MVWVSQGWYEFCSLPYPTKIKLSPPDVEALLTLPDRYTGIVIMAIFFMLFYLLQNQWNSC